MITWNSEKLAKHNEAWKAAKVEFAALYPDVDFANVPPFLFSKIAMRAEEIRKGAL